MIKRCIAYGAAMLVILYTFLIYDAEVLSAILILSILYPILSLSWLALTRKSLRTERDRVPEMGEEGKEIRAGILLKNLSRYFAIQYEVKIVVTDRNREEKAVKSAGETSHRKAVRQCGVILRQRSVACLK